MAARDVCGEKSKAVTKHRVTPALFKRRVTEDESLIFRLDVEQPGYEILLDVEDPDPREGGMVELAIEVGQIDELIGILTKAKETAQAYNRGESDVEEEEDFFEVVVDEDDDDEDED